jgi:glycosyltransferase involved in cell wall biosynthesis
VRVGVNLLWLRPGLVGGSEEYLLRQLAALPALDPDIELTVFGVPSLASAHPDLARVATIVAAPSAAVRARPIRISVETTWLAAHVRRRHLDLVHHGGGTVPAGNQRVPTVLTIHDLQYLTYPQYFSIARRRYLTATMPRSARRADAICVPSAFVARTVAEAFAVPAERIFVAPHGLPQPQSDDDDDDIRLIVERLRLPERYVIYPAITHPHKNHVTLLRALARVDQIGAVLLGGRGRADDEVSTEIARLGLAERVVRPGRVPDATRDALYRHAVALTFPSRYEGFGAPVIEAMALGCPVLAADATALTEVVGDGGELLPPDEVAAWAAALTRLRDDDTHRAALIAKGRARASHFTAAASARALVTAYRSVLR